MDPLGTNASIWLRSRGWLAFLGAGLALAAAVGRYGDEGAAAPVLFIMGLAATAAILIGVRFHRPTSRVPWRLLALCTFVSGIGIPLLPVPGAIGLVGQLLSSVGATLGFAGFILLIRGRIPGGDRAAILDAAMVASGIGVLIWAFGLAPYVLAERGTSVVATVTFYPAIVALAMVARLWFLPGRHRPATRLIVLLVIASNAIIGLSVVRAATGLETLSGLLTFANFAELALMGAAALHPAMAIAPEPHGPDPQPLSRRRIATLTAALLVNPVVLAVDNLDGVASNPTPYVIGGVIIALLVMARLGDALSRLGESLQERDSLLEQLRRMALYDALTSLPNRSLFNARLTAAYADRTTDRLLAVLLLDIDDFKAVNDRFGHDAGDILLTVVGQRLREAIRNGDTAARLGGDEFVMVVPDCADPGVAVGVAERILAKLSEPFDIGGQRLQVRASIGVAIAGTDDLTADDLVRNADIAMYEAKRRGKGSLEVFVPAMRAAWLRPASVSSLIA